MYRPGERRLPLTFLPRFPTKNIRGLSCWCVPVFLNIYVLTTYKSDLYQKLSRNLTALGRETGRSERRVDGPAGLQQRQRCGTLRYGTARRSVSGGVSGSAARCVARRGTEGCWRGREILKQMCAKSTNKRRRSHRKAGARGCRRWWAAPHRHGLQWPPAQLPVRPPCAAATEAVTSALLRTAMHPARPGVGWVG